MNVTLAYRPQIFILGIENMLIYVKIFNSDSTSYYPTL